jgi:hypothetical protein
VSNFHAYTEKCLPGRGIRVFFASI